MINGWKLYEGTMTFSISISQFRETIVSVFTDVYKTKNNYNFKVNYTVSGTGSVIKNLGQQHKTFLSLK